MAYTSTVLLALLVVATASVGVTVAHGSDGTITGSVTCLATGTVIPGVTVSVSCDRGQTTIGQGVTGDTGTCTIVVPAVLDQLLLSVLCWAIATIPAGTCNGLPATGPWVTTSAPIGFSLGVASFVITFG